MKQQTYPVPTEKPQPLPTRSAYPLGHNAASWQAHWVLIDREPLADVRAAIYDRLKQAKP